MPDALITHFFQKKNKPGTTSKKRPPSKSDQDEDPDWTPTNTTKRSKVAGNKGKGTRTTSSEPATRPRAPDSNVTLVGSTLPLQTPGASSSKFKTPAGKRKVIVISSDGTDATMVGNTPDVPVNADLFSRYRSPLPPSSAPSSSSRYGRKVPPREESIIPATPEQEGLFSSPKSTVTPIRLNLKPLSQTWSDETVDSSQSQEDVDLEEYGGASINLTRTLFGSPRSNWATKGSVDFRDEDEAEENARPLAVTVSPQVIGSSQSQSQHLSHASSQRPGARATVLIEEHLELIPSSQSQEKELDINTVLSQRSGWQHIRSSTTPDLPHQLQVKKSSSLSKELPVRRLSLREDDDPGPLADDLDPPERPSLMLTASHFTPKRSRRETQQWDTPSQRQVASTLLEHDYQADESCSMISPTRSVRFGSSQGFPYSQSSFLSQRSPTRRLFPSSQNLPSTPSKAAAVLDDSQTQEMTPVSVHHSTSSKAALLLDDSQTQEMTPLSVHQHSPDIMSPQSLPPEVKEFHAMFEGGGEDESYPPDFPMSLRI